MTNGKQNKTNGKAQEKKIIPKDVWTAFFEYWDDTEWESLTVADIKKHLGKYVFVAIPKNITDKTAGKAWYDQISQFREKGKGGSVVILYVLPDKKRHLKKYSVISL